MKLQALGWLTAGVLAAGVNASYHNGDLQWAHRIADRVGYQTNTVLALATGNVDRFYSEARLSEVRMARVGEENNSPCRFSLTRTHVENAMPQADVAFAQFERASDREQAQLAKLAARRARMEAHFAWIEIPAVNVPAVHVQPVVMKIPDVHVCSRVRVSVPNIPAVKIPAIPQVRVEVSGAGPV